MPFPLKTLQKLSSFLESGDPTLPGLEAKAVSEKIGYQKDAVLTALEAGTEGAARIAQQAQTSKDRLMVLQKAFQNLAPAEVLDWVTAVAAVDAYDTPQEKAELAEHAKAALVDQAADSAAALHADFPSYTLKEIAGEVQAAVDSRVQAAQADALEDLGMAASIQAAENRLHTLQTLNDQAGGSLAAITRCPAVLEDACPFLLAVLSRKNDYYGLGSIGSDTSGTRPFSASDDVVIDNSASGLVASAPDLYKLVTGQHANSTSLTGFYLPPHVAFLQGSKGSFSLQQLYTRYQANESVYRYPYAAVGIFYLTNTTDTDRLIPLILEGSADSTAYGAGVFVRHSAEAPGGISDASGTGSSGAAGAWTPLYILKQAHPNFGITIDIPIPAHQMVELMVITTATPPAMGAPPAVAWVAQFLSFTVSGLKQPGVRMAVPFSLGGPHENLHPL